MRGKSGSSLRLVLGPVSFVMLVPVVWAYVNGGDYHDTRKTFEKRLKAEGWGVSFGAPMPADCDVNQLVGKAIQALPAKDADVVSVEVKREVARLIREAIQSATAEGKEDVRKGKTGSIEYQAGVQGYESYWETNYNKKREIHAHRTGLVPFIALKIVKPKDRP